MVGKRVARRTYAHVSLIDDLAEDDRRRIEEAVQISGLKAGEHFHVARLDTEHEEVALLSYPTFFEELYPSLLASWRVHLPTKAVRFRDYSSSLNPPILHRKELMLPASHPDQERLQQVTRLAESIGLFDDPVRIGFRSQWNELVASKGYTVVGQELVPASNVTEPAADDTSPGLPTGTAVHRHLTALSRSFLSAPVQALLRHDLIKESRSFFDYGCGKGDDIEGVRSLGISAAGWDPHFRTDGTKQPADVVNIGFVINVIENLEERIEALQGAYALTQGVLIGLRHALVHGRCERAAVWGWLPDLPQYLPEVLQPGRAAELHRKRPRRAGDPGRPRRVLRLQGPLPRAAIPIRPPVRPVPSTPASSSSSHSAASHSGLHGQSRRSPRKIRHARRRPTRSGGAHWNWGVCLKKTSTEEAAHAVQIFGSWQRAIRAATRQVDHDLLQQAASARADEIRAFFAMQAFGRRKPLRDLEPRLQRDIKAFFGSLGVAELEGRRLLHQCADVEAVKAACERAASMGLGWLDADHSLQLHTSLVPRLDPDPTRVRGMRHRTLR